MNTPVYKNLTGIEKSRFEMELCFEGFLEVVYRLASADPHAGKKAVQNRIGEYVAKLIDVEHNLKNGSDPHEHAEFHSQARAELERRIAAEHQGIAPAAKATVPGTPAPAITSTATAAPASPKAAAPVATQAPAVKTMTLDAFKALPSPQQNAFIRDGGKLRD